MLGQALEESAKELSDAEVFRKILEKCGEYDKGVLPITLEQNYE
jgi:hypothetical protein